MAGKKPANPATAKAIDATAKAVDARLAALEDSVAELQRTAGIRWPSSKPEQN